MTVAAPPASRTINVRLPAELYEQLESLAQATARTKSFVTLEALSSYLAAQSWQVQDIAQGVQEADAGEFANADEVAAVFTRHGA
ncbi:Uncharacterised protein [uncultured Comamonas sp.]|nr:Uncharacterised protein [uncultured Comamonas sp.]